MPLAVTQGQSADVTTENSTLEKQQSDADARARNWLMIQYEQQFRGSKAATSPNERTFNMYLQLSMNNDLAAVANQASADSHAPDNAATPAPSLHATPNSASQKGVGLRPDTTPGPRTFTPLFNALSSPISTAASQPFDTGAYAAALPKGLAPVASLDAPPASAPPTPSRPPSPVATLPTDTIDVQTPGLIADKADPLAGPDLNLDSLPDSNDGNAQNSQPAELPQLPEALDENLLHAQQTAKLEGLKGAQAKAKAQPPVQAPTAAATPPPPEAPDPISKQPQISPVHAPLPNPFDILNH